MAPMGIRQDELDKKFSLKPHNGPKLKTIRTYIFPNRAVQPILYGGNIVVAHGASGASWRIDGR